MTGEFHRSIGLELGGSRNDRTAVAVFDHFPRTRQLILTEVALGHAGREGTETPDEALIELLNEFAGPRLSGLGIHAPTCLPPFFRPADKGAIREVQWMRKTWDRLRPRPAPFLTYMQRPAEIWLRHETPEKFNVTDALGANGAPILARYHYLASRLPGPVNEVFPRAALARLVSALGLPKNITRYYTDVERGLAFREDFFNGLRRKLPQIFFYEKDLETMILHINCFHAALAAFTQHLAAKGETEPRPKGFPRDAAWIHIPKPDPDWKRVFD